MILSSDYWAKTVSQSKAASFLLLEVGGLLFHSHIRPIQDNSLDAEKFYTWGLKVRTKLKVPNLEHEHLWRFLATWLVTQTEKFRGNSPLWIKAHFTSHLSAISSFQSIVRLTLSETVRTASLLATLTIMLSASGKITPSFLKDSNKKLKHWRMSNGSA